MILRREQVCIRALAWRLDLPTTVDWELLFSSLERQGLVRRPAVGALVRFESAHREWILCLPTTGRVQIRLHYETPAARRRHSAERLAALVLSVVLGRSVASTRRPELPDAAAPTPSAAT